MKTLENLLYTKDHEWLDKKNESVAVGITDFAQSSLGDIVFVELPEVGSEFSQGDSFGVVESIKSVSDLYAPITGKIIEINEEIVDSPEKLNEGCYESWLVKITPSNTTEMSSLMNAEEYSKHCQSEQ